MQEETQAAADPVPYIGRFKTTAASAQGAAQALAAAFQKDGFTVIVVTYDGRLAPAACAPCRPEGLRELLAQTMLVEMDQLREGKVIVVIDAQPVFHEGKAYHPIKPDVVDALIAEMQEAWADDDLSGIYVQE
ncbi:hypothetical protein [Comamonas sp.]|uniref:hypothetical protein n=1 Tax=Comamonas sp. TaxID=34028 RepID=UPI003A95496C